MELAILFLLLVAAVVLFAIAAFTGVWDRGRLVAAGLMCLALEALIVLTDRVF